jgi:hypothetical protein
MYGGVIEIKETCRANNIGRRIFTASVVLKGRKH